MPQLNGFRTIRNPALQWPCCVFRIMNGKGLVVRGVFVIEVGNMMPDHQDQVRHCTEWGGVAVLCMHSFFIC